MVECEHEYQVVKEEPVYDGDRLVEVIKQLRCRRCGAIKIESYAPDGSRNY